MKLAILSVQNVTKLYKNHKVLDSISLEIDEPGIWALVGPNGVGKTTLLNVITNIIPATSGTVELVGKSNKDPSVFKEVAFLQDNTVLFEYLNGYDHLKYVCEVQKLDKQRIQKVAKYVGMESYLKKTVGTYSLGMKQHLLLAMAIMNNPKLLFLDEPLNGLDPTSSILMRKILLELAENGTTIILSSHNLAEIDRVTKQILFLKNGKIQEVNMGDHEVTYYEFTVSDSNFVMKLLTEKMYDVQQEGRKITIQLKNQELDHIIELIKDYEIRIYDIQKVVTGSEQLYERIFEV